MRRLLGLFAASVGAMTLFAGSAAANGTETLGPPSVGLAPATGLVVAGAGMHAFPNDPRPLSVNVPEDATVKQVLLYWEGNITQGAGFADDSITVNGTPVTGDLIGGPTNAFLAQAFSVYRADISSLNVVGPGTNTLTIDEMLFPTTFVPPSGNDGVGVLVLYEDPSSTTPVQVFDGQDFAFRHFSPPLDTTVPQTFTFAPQAAPRIANLATMVGSIAGDDFAGRRPNQLVYSFDGGPQTIVDTPWQSFQGKEFDALNLLVTVPSGATSLTVQARSEGTPELPASLDWLVAGAFDRDRTAAARRCVHHHRRGRHRQRRSLLGEHGNVVHPVDDQEVVDERRQR